MIFVLKMLFTFVYNRKNENHWSLLVAHYSLLITRCSLLAAHYMFPCLPTSAWKHCYGNKICFPGSKNGLYRYVTRTKYTYMSFIININHVIYTVCVLARLPYIWLDVISVIDVIGVIGRS